MSCTKFLLIILFPYCTEALSSIQHNSTKNVIFKNIPEAPNYRSNASYDSKGMEQVYWLTNTFIDLITRDQVLPATINVTMIHRAVQGGLEDTMELVRSHWQDLLLQYVGLLTAVIVGVLTALCLPVVGLFVCCCRCAGKCGAYPQTYYDKKSDSCKRFCTGIVLSIFVIGVMFGCACVFLTNQYKHDGMVQFPQKFSDSLEDADLFLKHSQASSEVLLVDNFLQLEARVLRDLQHGGSIIKERLANKTGAGAVDSLYKIVSSLGKVKRKLREMRDDTNQLDSKIAQLKDGLARSERNLRSVLAECEDSPDCRTFLTKYSLSDLALTEEFKNTEFRMPNLSDALDAITQLIDERLEEKISDGKKNFDKIEETISSALSQVSPLVQPELSKFGGDLKGYNSKLKDAIGNIDLRSSWKKEGLDQRLSNASLLADKYLYYLGLGMGGAVLLILLFYVLGLFYGLCGNTPHDMYTGDCCDRRTGASLIAVASYLTFLLGCPLLLLTTAHFILGTGMDQVLCRTLEQPGQSHLLKDLDRELLRPVVGRVVGRQTDLSTPGLLQACHDNNTIYNILNLDRVYDVTNMKKWRTQYKLQSLEAGLNVSRLPDMTLLSRQTEEDLQLLVRSELSNLDLRKYGELSEDQIFRTDIRNFVRQLEILKEQLGKKQGLRDVASKLRNPADFLENMLKVAEEVRLKLRHLKESTKIYYGLLQLNSGPLGENILQLVERTKMASKSLNSQGPNLLKELTAEHVNSSLALVDQFVDLIVVGFQRDVGHCAPLSSSYNATVAALCQEIVQPFNGFWAAVGWCCVLYLPCSIISLCLTALYRKTEKYPGPVVDAETQPLDGHKRRERRGHRRSYSRSERTSSRALPPIPVEERPHSRYRSSDRDPPRYSSNPNMSSASAPPASRERERERPPPYYSPQH